MRTPMRTEPRMEECLLPSLIEWKNLYSPGLSMSRIFGSNRRTPPKSRTAYRREPNMHTYCEERSDRCQENQRGSSARQTVGSQPDASEIFLKCECVRYGSMRYCRSV